MKSVGITNQKKPMEFLTEDLSEKYGIITRVERITPEIASKYLKCRRPNQRKISSAALSKYMSDMVAGGWQLNGEAIVFGKDGSLMNGNHRLSAIIRTQTTIESVVIRGIDENVFIYDVQNRRSAKDRMSMSNIEDMAPCVSSAVQNLLGKFTPVAGNAVVTDYIKAHESDLRRAYNTCCRGAMGKYSKKASCVLGAYLMLRTKKAQFFQLEAFFDIFNSGVPTIAGSTYEPSPAMIARKMIDEMDKNQRHRSRYQLEIIIQAMEDFFAGNKRVTPYSVQSDNHWEHYADEVLAEDGFEV